MITRNFDLYLNKTCKPPLIINVNQYDEGETWVFSLFAEDGTAYTPTSGAIVGIKSDGLIIANAGTVVNGKAVVVETEQMTASAGKAIFELQIDGETHGTANFYVMVEKSPIDGGTLSESDISIYQGLLDIAPSNTGEAGQVLTKTENGAEWANGGGGGDEFVITFTSIEHEDWTTEADKTYAEVIAAIEAKKPIIAYHFAKDYGGYFGYDEHFEQLTLVRKPEGNGKSLFFFGTPAFFYNELTSQFTNTLVQIAIELRSDDSCKWHTIIGRTE